MEMESEYDGSVHLGIWSRALYVVILAAATAAQLLVELSCTPRALRFAGGLRYDELRRLLEQRHQYALAVCELPGRESRNPFWEPSDHRGIHRVLTSQVHLCSTEIFVPMAHGIEHKVATCTNSTLTSQ